MMMLLLGFRFLRFKLADFISLVVEIFQAVFVNLLLLFDSTGGPLKPDFGLSGDVHTSQTWANEQTTLS